MWTCVCLSSIEVEVSLRSPTAPFPTPSNTIYLRVVQRACTCVCCVYLYAIAIE